MRYKQRIIELATREPHLTAAQIAFRLLCHPKYVHTIGRNCGLQFASPAIPAMEPAE